MSRIVRAVLLGLLLTLILGFVAKHGFSIHADDPGPAGAAIPPVASLSMMVDGTAHQPFVRRQLVPFILRCVDGVTPLPARIAADRWLASSPLRPVLFGDAPFGAWHSLFCLLIWFCSFSVFAYVLESEARHYAAERSTVDAQRNLFPIVFSVLACVVVVALLHNNYIYDPPTLAFSVLALRSLRRARLWELVLITALFSCNRETAFIVPGMTFFYWMHRRQPDRAFAQAALLSVIYFAIAGTLIYFFRGNAGAMAENNFQYLVHMYLHEKLHYALAAAVALCLYAVAVIRYWRLLPPALKSVQWFVLPWVALHIRWGWPMEWRVFLEIYPGVLLTVFTLLSGLRSTSRNLASATAPRLDEASPARIP